MKRFSPKETAFLKVVRNILEKRPWEFGVVLEEEGWIPIKELQKVLKEEGIKGPSAKGLIQFFEVYRPDGIELQGGKIRAIPHAGLHQSRSNQVAYPPDTLYIGMRERAIEGIRRHGLDGRRQRIVLSSSKEMAQRIIARKTAKYVLIEVDSKAAQGRGIRFESLGGTLYTCPYLPSKWMRLPEKKEEEEGTGEKAQKKGHPRAQKEDKAQELGLPGSFHMGLDPTEVSYFEQKIMGRRRRWDKGHKKGKRRK